MLIIEKINGVMTTNVMGNNQEWCSDHLLEIMNEILHQAADLKQAQADSVLPQQVYEQLTVNFKAFIKLLTASDVVSIQILNILDYY